MGEKLSPGRSTGYMIIKRIPPAIYNYWKAPSDNGISGADMVYVVCFKPFREEKIDVSCGFVEFR
jgi:hypothetical protein